MKIRSTLFLASLGLAAASQAAFNFTVFPAAQWGVSDATLGVTGYTIEDFEDVNLAAGLQVSVASPNGGYGPTSTLPATFMPSQDLFGTAFTFGGGGVWDGTRGIINTRTNQTFSYSDGGSWGDLIFHFSAPARSVGFSVQQADLDGVFRINGVAITSFSSIGLPLNGLRQGYIRIDATGTDTISTLMIDNGTSGNFGDGLMIDHVAFNPVPEPTTLAVLGAFALAARRRRR